MQTVAPTSALAASPLTSGWGAAYASHGPDLLRYLHRLTGERAAAEDLLQETFVRAMRARAAPVQDLEMRRWLYRIATNLAIDRARRRRRTVVVGLHEQTATAVPDERDADRLVRDVLRMIPSDEAAVLVLRLHERLSRAEIASMLGISERQVKERLSRARTSFVRGYRRLQQEER